MPVDRDSKAKPIQKKSYEAETSPGHQPDKPKTQDRSLLNHPVDPNALTEKGNFPPGVSPKAAADPGRATPGAPPVDNRSGQKKP
ncbi:hypothetical protein EKL30_10475 [Candidimonas sp. SYP-B2681]|uniref:hypothetical protein n=1 Tax=Candidimonas sp. SYP-B2681 TaxID=2497686 RepID=UPI000F89B48E|nr:hypothetical protein [Candidimonas sp. SYP-B2681]RTZ43291.1 hypothetical protein EKL30_10475 [Candidimonas sp. SYP-B2681]